MATLPDSSGLMTSSCDVQSIDCFETALASLFRSDGKALPALARAIEADPVFAAGHCLRAAALVLGGTDTPAAELAASVEAIERSRNANPRERRHADAARRWLDGKVACAARLYGALVRDFPRDRLALLVAQSLDFRLGRRKTLRARIERVLPHWDANDREYGYLLGMLAFGLEETGHYDRALAAARRSLELVPDNASAIHVIAHVLEMTGPPEMGIAWLRGMQPTWAGNAGFSIHLAWHLALFQLDADAAADALATYDTLIAPRLDAGSSVLVDASALLWRLQLFGTGSRRRWREVTGLWLRQRIVGNRAFDLVHAVMALASSKQHARARRLAARLEADAMLRAHSGTEELALAGPLTAAILSFCRGDYDGAVESISAIRAAADRCGGSVAQCDLIHLTLLEAALRAHRRRLARTLAAERAKRKPASRLNRLLEARAWTSRVARLAS